MRSKTAQKIMDETPQEVKDKVKDYAAVLLFKERLKERVRERMIELTEKISQSKKAHVSNHYQGLHHELFNVLQLIDETN